MSWFYRCFCGEVTAGDSVVYFDMDGTIADLYAVDGWLDMIRSSDPYPYANAALMIDSNRLHGFVDDLHGIGWKVGIISWLAKMSNPSYDEAVAEAKFEWLDRFFPAVDEILIIPYGEAKYEAVIPEEAILIDDEPLNRMHWDASGPLRRSYPAEELDDLIGLLRGSLEDSVADEMDFDGSGIVTVEELADAAYKRMLFGVGDAGEHPSVTCYREGADYGIMFLNAEGTAYYSPYIECIVPIGNPELVTQQEIEQVLAKADRLTYDIS